MKVANALFSKRLNIQWKWPMVKPGVFSMLWSTTTNSGGAVTGKRTTK